MQDIATKIETAFQFLRARLNGRQPTLAVVLGSGFAGWVDQLDDMMVIPYSTIPHFAATTVAGHQGRLIIADLEGQTVVIMQGRYHFYEGHSMAIISLPIRVFHRLGIQTLLLTNAAGGINEHYQPGDLMILQDHINLVQDNPLIGPNLSKFGPRFPDASAVYDKKLAAYAAKLAKEKDIAVHHGVYIFVSGPCFETPAEIRMMARLGADAVGMSTVPEAITARHAGMQIAGISLIANLAAGRNTHALSHEEVMQTMARVAPKMHSFLNQFAIYLARINSK